MGFLYETATLDPRVLGAWEDSPYKVDTTRAFGLLQVHRKSWRATDGRGFVKMLTANHPRLVQLDVASQIAATINDLLWSQRVTITQHLEFTTPVPGGEAHADLIGMRLDIPLEGGFNIPPITITPPKGLAGRIISDLPTIRSMTVGSDALPNHEIPHLIGTDLTLLLLTWSTGRGLAIVNRYRNDHAYLALADKNHENEILDAFPRAIAYA